MTSPVLWIFIPAAASIVLFFIRNRARLVTSLGVGLCILLALLAWALPIGRPMTLGPWSFLPAIQIGDSYAILGRRLVLENSDRIFLILIFLGLAFWFGGSIIARAGRLFVPLGLAMGVALTAALAVEPFLYAALFIELAVLISIPLLSPPGSPVRDSVLRYLTFQTLGMPFILFSGWLLTGIGSEPTNPALTIRITSLLGLGFALLLAIFPFHIWIPMIAQDVQPYRATFVIFVVPTVISLFAMGFFDQYTWLQSLPALYSVLIFLGTLMVVGGGIWALLQNHVGRMFGFTIVAEIGLTLLVIGLSGRMGNEANLAAGANVVSTVSEGYLFAQLLPRGISLALWALAVSTWQRNPDQLGFPALAGISRQFPIATASVLIAQLSLAGMPLLAAFPLRIRLWTVMATISPLATIMLVIGSAALIFAGLRMLLALLKSPGPATWKINETRTQRVLLILGCSMILFIGLLPQYFYPILINFSNLIGAIGP